MIDTNCKVSHCVVCCFTLAGNPNARYSFTWRSDAIIHVSGHYRRWLPNCPLRETKASRHCNAWLSSYQARALQHAAHFHQHSDTDSFWLLQQSMWASIFTHLPPPQALVGISCNSRATPVWHANGRPSMNCHLCRTTLFCSVNLCLDAATPFVWSMPRRKKKDQERSEWNEKKIRSHPNPLMV